MATRIVIPEIHEIPGGSAVGVRVRWAGLGVDSVGAPVSKTEYRDKTIQITGDLLDGDLEGTNTPEIEDSWMVLLDDDTNDRLKRVGFYHVNLNPIAIRPHVRDGRHVAFDIVYTR